MEDYDEQLIKISNSLIDRKKIMVVHKTMSFANIQEIMMQINPNFELRNLNFSNEISDNEFYKENFDEIFYLQN